MKLRINRQEWMRGETQKYKRFDAVLWDMRYNCGCCLGHACKELFDIPKDRLEGRHLPDEVFDDTQANFMTKEPDSLNIRVSDFCFDAAAINDDTQITDERREELLIELFAKQNVELEFYN